MRIIQDVAWLFFGLLLRSLSSTGSPINASRYALHDAFHWVDIWTSMPQLVEPSNLPPIPFNSSTSEFKNATLRQTFHLSLGAPKIRIQISNIFGGSDLPITAASLALPADGQAGSASIDISTLAALTFGGKSSVTIPKGSSVHTDPIDFAVKAESELTLSLYLRSGQLGNNITGHPGSRTTSWMSGGNHVNDPSVNGTSIAHWYFASAVEAWTPSNTSGLIILADSSTDGRGSTDNANNRWPDLLLARTQSTPTLTTLSILNQAAGGNSILSGGLGPPLLNRYHQDAISQPGAAYVLIFEGVNDIGSAADTASAQQAIGDGLIAAYTRIARDCRAAGLRVFGATITPFGGEGQVYDGRWREGARRRVNAWMLGAGLEEVEAGREGNAVGVFDAVLDFAAWVADSGNASRLAGEYDSGDHLHMNSLGYQKLADQFPLGIF